MRALYHHRTQGRDVEAIHIGGLAGGLEELGFKVRIVGPPGVHIDPDAVPAPDAPTRAAKQSPWAWVARRVPQLLFELMEIGYNAVAVPRLWKACREWQPDLIYERYALCNFAGVLVGRMLGIPTVLEVNETVRVDRTRQGKRIIMSRLAGWFECRILRSATGIAVVSGYLKDYAVECGVPAERIRVTPNAVDVSRFDPERVSGAAVRQRWGLEGKTVVGFAGSFAKWHGVELLIRACAPLVADFPDLALLLVGDGPRRPDAEALAADLGIADRVVFTGKVPHSAIPEHAAAMDAGVMPASNVYGSPMKVFEYMAMGCPPLAPRYRPLEEAIDQGRDGLLFEPGSEADLTGCLRRLLADPEERARLGAAARRKILAERQWVHNARTVVDLAAGPEQPAPAVRRSERQRV